MKSGKEFEELVLRIQTYLADHAKVEPNVRLPDKDSGRSRQIDILVSISDGPLTWRTIVEVRDHARPVGVEYVDTVSSKRTSVGVNMAVIVSRSGFTKAALSKAQNLGIRAFTYQDTLNTEWADWLKTTVLTFDINRYRLVNLTPRLSLEVEEKYKAYVSLCPATVTPNDFIFATGDEKIHTNLDSLLRRSSFFPSLWEGVSPNTPPVTRRLRLTPNDPLYLILGDVFIPVWLLDVTLEVTRETRDKALVYGALKNEAGLPIMDVLSSSEMVEGREVTIEMMTAGGKRILEKGQKVYFRIETREPEKKE